MNRTELKLKNNIKLAFRQAIDERKELFDDIIADVLEDIALGKAIEEGLNSGRVSEEDVLSILKAR
jgi:hypothetical protein